MYTNNFWYVKRTLCDLVSGLRLTKGGIQFGTSCTANCAMLSLGGTKNESKKQKTTIHNPLQEILGYNISPIIDDKQIPVADGSCPKTWCVLSGRP